jgi:dipeptidyl aminopeptidase/acylaminoacyl peptidase
VLARGDPAETIQVTNTPFDEHNPRTSPDGRWIAYQSNDSGKNEVFVQAFPRGGAKQQASAGGGVTPVWHPDGSELSYLTTDGTVMARSVTVVGGQLRLGAPTRLFRADIAFTGIGKIFSVARDGRFLLSVVPADREPSSLVVLHNWAATLQ